MINRHDMAMFEFEQQNKPQYSESSPRADMEVEKLTAEVLPGKVITYNEYTLVCKHCTAIKVFTEDEFMGAYTCKNCGEVI
jgi:hypothetical protein